MNLVAAVALGVTGGLVIALYQIDRGLRTARRAHEAAVHAGPCPHCDEAATVVDGCCVHCGADRAGEL